MTTPRAFQDVMVCWSRRTHGSADGSAFSSPFEFTCRYVEGVHLYLNSMGEEASSEAVVYVPLKFTPQGRQSLGISVGDYVMLGHESDVIGITHPNRLANSHLVRQIAIEHDIRRVRSLAKMYL